MKQKRLVNSVLLYIVVFIVILLNACTSVSTESNQYYDKGQVECNGGSWLVPCQQIVDGGPGVDGIPSVDEPKFSKIQDIQFLEDWELVLVVKNEKTIKAYPHVILYYHEIINDQIGELPLAVTFCPLTGSGIGWNRKINGSVTEFGVSGLIHKNNLIPYDRNTGSRWSQMLGKSINGELKGKEINTVQTLEMTWGAFKDAFPNSLVLNTETGFERNYNKYLYGEDYPEDDSRILFPVYHPDERLEAKTLIHGIRVGLNSKVYPVNGFDSNIELINDEFEGEKVLIAGSSLFRLVVSYKRELGDGTILEFKASQADLPVMASDQEGNIWNIWGEAISGPRKGETLILLDGYNAYWFAWADFFNFPQIFRFN